jgi:pyruvate carboxylase
MPDTVTPPSLRASVERQHVRRLLAANRSEIAIRIFRAAHELGIRTVAMYAHEDRFALHRFKADEAYEIGRPGEPLRSYLEIGGIIALARQQDIDAIHPGYGFLSENAEFAQACRDAGILFIGPRPEVLRLLGDKVAARKIARQAGVPILSGSDAAISDRTAAHALAAQLGYPVIVKASMGGGGRGMRVATGPDQLNEALEQARREAATAFGVPDVFLEKYVQHARHLEVQLLGDHHGNLVHLFERDCSVQRRHQKVVEIAPALNLDADTRRQLLEAALAIGRAVRLDNAGTVEFLLDADTGKFYFIEVNPRIQVEHTVTEEITGYDLIKCQILIAQDFPLTDPEIGLDAQENVRTHGYALQCRVTTEDPGNRFIPDYGRLSAYRSASGMGIRLDAGTAFGGAVITPFFDSLLVKVTAHGLRFVDAARHMERCLQEFRIRGVKNNIPFLINLVKHPDFLAGNVTTKFIDERPELFQFAVRQDRATKLLTYIAEIIVNGHPELRGKEPGGKNPPAEPYTPAPVPQNRRSRIEDRGSTVATSAGVPPSTVMAQSSTRDARPAAPAGTRDKLLELGPERFAGWVLEQKRLLITDTTFRDAHQSLLATRMRTFDMLHIASVYAQRHAGLFSLEMWGGATFDTSLRFLKEDPWQRLAELREHIPNILFQMLLRANNAVGYTNYPDNVVKAFIREAARSGIDLFRIFDALNWVPNMRLAIETVRAAGVLCEAAICYTGDILNPERSKYGLSYYVNLARELEKLGANLLAIKDMAGLCKPFAARQLVRALKQEIGIPVHFHTHDSAGGQMASLVIAAEEGVDIVDAAMGPLSGVTSQPNLNTLVEALRFTDRETGLDFESLQATAQYWEAVRHFYHFFETGLFASSAEVYRHEMPGGQYTNLIQQAAALGLQDRWEEVRRMYAHVNDLFGDIIKVTPTSKVVGDMALFLVANNLTPAEVLNPQRELAFPTSVVELFEGKLGQPPGGFPEQLQKVILRGRQPLTDRPGATLPPADFEAARHAVEKLGVRPTDQQVLSDLLYPRVYPEFTAHQARYSDTSVLPTPVFFTGMVPGSEINVNIEAGKTLIIKFLTVGDPHVDGTRLVFFELNGQPREVMVADVSLTGNVQAHPKADPNNPQHISAPMPGLVVNVAVAPGDTVRKGQKLLTMEAMKMESTVYAELDAGVAEVLVKPRTQVEAGDLLLRLEQDAAR